VPTTTIVNDGSIFLLLGIWCSLPRSANHSPLAQPDADPSHKLDPEMTLTRTSTTASPIASNLQQTKHAT